MATAVDKPRRSAGDVIKSYLPILSWLPAYQKGSFRDGLEEAIPAEHLYPGVQASVDAFLAEEQSS